MFSLALVSLHLLETISHQSCQRREKNPPKNQQTNFSGAEASVQPFSRSESRCSRSVLEPGASFSRLLPQQEGRRTRVEIRFIIVLSFLLTLEVTTAPSPVGPHQHLC